MVLKYLILLVQPIGNQYMYGTKQKKVSEYGLNQINKRVLLLVPKLIIIWEGTPTPDDVTGVFPWCHQWGNHLKQQDKVPIRAHTCIQTVLTKVAQFDTCMSCHCILSLRSNNYRGIPLLGGQGEYYPLEVDKTHPRGDTEGINN